MKWPLSLLLAAAVAPAAGAQVFVHVVLPEPLAAGAVSALHDALGDSAAVGQVGWSRLTAAGPGILVGVDEWQLWQLERAAALAPVAGLAGDLPRGYRDTGDRWVLPWTLGYVLAWAPDVFGDSPPGSWEDLALAHEVHDALGLCSPRFDPTPWLAAMEESLLNGNGEVSGYALWTTLDARAPGYADGYPMLQRHLADGMLAAAVMPATAALQLQQQQGQQGGREVRSSDLGVGTPVARLGVAVQGDLDAETEAVVRLLVTEPLRSRLARQIGLGAVGSGDVGPRGGRFEGALVERWLQHFEDKVEGKGRGIEDVADTLDLVFTLLFLAIVLVIWLYYRRTGKNAAGSAPPD